MQMYQVDAFSRQLFQGNPAAVLILEQWLDDTLMQQIAAENNLSETAFVQVIDAENYRIRWFTPQVEVDFCGHATLASAFVLFQFYTQAKQIRFHVKDLGIFNICQAVDGRIEMDFPVRMPQRIEDYPAELENVIDRPIQAVYQNQQAFILLCASEQDVIAAKPNFQMIQSLAEQYARSSCITASDALDISVTAAASTQAGNDEKFDYVARYFAPHKGIPEDPVTGSMHTGLAPLWAALLNKQQLRAWQCSARGGELFCVLKDNQRIEISGYAKLYMKAEIYIEV